MEWEARLAAALRRSSSGRLCAGGTGGWWRSLPFSQLPSFRLRLCQMRLGRLDFNSQLNGASTLLQVSAAGEDNLAAEFAAASYRSLMTSRDSAMHFS